MQSHFNRDAVDNDFIKQESLPIYVIHTRAYNVYTPIHHIGKRRFYIFMAIKRQLENV